MRNLASKFASALSTFMVGTLGLASAGDKLSIAYGGEAGKMDPGLEALVRKYCADSSSSLPTLSAATGSIYNIQTT